MASYLVANYDVNDRDGYKEYLAAVGPIIAAHGGRVLVAGSGATAVEGSPGEITIVLEFPTRDALERWYNCQEYQAIIGLRTENTEGMLIFADEFALPH